MDIFELIQKGGVIVYILILLNIIGISIMLLKLFSYYQFKKEQNSIVEDIELKIKNTNNNITDIYLTSLVLASTKRLESGLNTIKIIAIVSPLLGLLGTVIGIFLSFNVISKVGLDNPAVFSTGISIALITTVVGLIVAIPHNIFYNYFIGLLDSFELDIKNKVLENIVK